MADDLAIVLHASAAETASGTGPSIDLRTDGVELRTLGELVLSVATLSAGGSLSVAVQSSLDGVVWAAVGGSAIASAVGSQTLWLGDFARYARIVWTLSGTTPSVTFSVTGNARASFCSVADLGAHGVVSDMIAGLSLALRAQACLAADGLARGYVGRRNTDAIKSVGFELRSRVAKLAAFDLLTTHIGFDPDQAHHKLLHDQYTEILRWLREDVGGGKFSITTSVADVTPDTVPGVGAVVTEDARGWGANGIL